MEVFWREGDTQYHLAGKSLAEPGLGYQYDALLGRSIQKKGEIVTSLENMAYSDLGLGDVVSILGEGYLLVGGTNVSMPMIDESAGSSWARPSFFCVMVSEDLEACADKLSRDPGWGDSHAGFIAQVVIGIHPKARINRIAARLGREASYLDLVVPEIDLGYEVGLWRRRCLLEAVTVLSAGLASILILRQRTGTGLTSLGLLVVGPLGSLAGILFAYWVV
jgi:hypothetical protein